MLEKKHEYIFVFFLICLIIFPVTDFSKAKKSNLENRRLANKPHIILKEKSIKKGINIQYGKLYDNWINDHFRGRTSIILKRAHMLQKIQKYYGAKWSNIEIYASKNYWMFDKGETNPIPVYDEQQKEKIYNNFQKLALFFKEKNIPFYFMIAPPKGEIYKEYNIRFLNKTDGIVDLKNYFLQRGGYQFYYPIDEIKEGKNQEYMFYKTDHHWTHSAGLLAYQIIMKDVIKKFLDVKIITDKNLKVSYFNKVKNWPFGGFTDCCSYERIVMKNRKYFKTDYKFYSMVADEVKLKCANRVCDFTNESAYNKKLLYAGNSFADTPSLFFAETFKNVRHVAANALGGIKFSWIKKQVQEYRPDLFIYIMHSNVSNQLLHMF